MLEFSNRSRANGMVFLCMIQRKTEDCGSASITASWKQLQSVNHTNSQEWIRVVTLSVMPRLFPHGTRVAEIGKYRSEKEIGTRKLSPATKEYSDRNLYRFLTNYAPSFKGHWSSYSIIISGILASSIYTKSPFTLTGSRIIFIKLKITYPRGRARFWIYSKFEQLNVLYSFSGIYGTNYPTWKFGDRLHTHWHSVRSNPTQGKSEMRYFLGLLNDCRWFVESFAHNSDPLKYWLTIDLTEIF